MKTHNSDKSFREGSEKANTKPFRDTTPPPPPPKPIEKNTSESNIDNKFLIIALKEIRETQIELRKRIIALEIPLLAYHKSRTSTIVERAETLQLIESIKESDNRLQKRDERLRRIINKLMGTSSTREEETDPNVIAELNRKYEKENYISENLENEEKKTIDDITEKFERLDD